MRLLSCLAIPLLLCAPLAAQEAEHTSIGGYGEVHYNNTSGPDSPGIINVARFVIFLSHQFNEKIAFRSELEVEDTKVEAGHDNAGEVSVEQVYLDYQLSSAATVRAGLLLAPIGIINETHEPTTFNGVDRPAFDNDVIPTTWRDLGVGMVGNLGSSGLSYRVYLLNGLVASGFTADEGIREGRQEGQLASFANPSLTGRLEWARPGLRIGGSFWYGGSANQDPALGTGTFDNAVALVSADARYDVGPFMFRGVVANISIADAEAINAAFSSQVGSRIAGGYVEGAYNVLSTLGPSLGPAVERLPSLRELQHPGWGAGRRHGGRVARATGHHLRTHLQAAVQCRLQGRLPAPAQQGRGGRKRSVQSGAGISVLEAGKPGRECPRRAFALRARIGRIASGNARVLLGAHLLLSVSLSAQSAPAAKVAKSIERIFGSRGAGRHASGWTRIVLRVSRAARCSASPWSGA